MAKLRYKYGTMGSSKSTELLITKKKYEQQGRKVLLFKPEDKRNEGVVYSRATREEVSCIVVNKDAYLFMFDKVAEEQPECVLVDECQFLTPQQVVELARIVDELNVPVIAYGLLTDFQGHLFPASQRFIELGSVTGEIENICYECGKRATHNLRYLGVEPVFEGEQIAIENLDATKELNTGKSTFSTTKKTNTDSEGTTYAYRAVCRHCYNEAKKVSSLKKLS